MSSCSKLPASPPEIKNLSQAQEYFLKICKEELNYDVHIIPAGKTMWAYIPLNGGIIDFTAAPKDQSPPVPAKESWSIAFLEGAFDHTEKTLAVSYDIEMKKKYDPKNTYQNKYSEEYSTKQREILTALTRAYFDVGQRNIETSLTVGKDSVTTTDPQVLDKMTDNPLIPAKDETPPEFFVMVFADTKNGVAVKAINYFLDMKMALSNPPAITNDEYMRRYIYEVFGDEDLIGDKTGERLKTEEIRLGDFLAKQITNRVKYEFTQSGFPPSGQARDEIWTIIAETFRLYNFNDFEKIKLIDLKTNEEATYDKNQL